MSPLVRKELRALVPPWAVAMALAIVPIWLAWPIGPENFPTQPGYLIYAPFAIGVLLLSLTPFGQELNWGTFSILLAQPVSRAQLWRLKTGLVGVAVLLVTVGFCLSVNLRVDAFMAAAKSTTWAELFSRPGGDPQLQNWIDQTCREALINSVLVGGLGAVAGFAGGLWTTLLFRQVSAAFWFTLLVPLGLYLLVEELAGGTSDGMFHAAAGAVLGLYSVAGLLWARSLFQRVQDTQWTGGVVSIPDWPRDATQARPAVGVRKRRVIRALLGKELQSQYVNVLLAGGLLLIHLLVLVVRRVNLEYLAQHRGVGMTLESFAVLWLAMPLLVGSVSIAEERKLGTFETVACLPISRGLQFGIKLLVALTLGILFGAIVPLALEWLGVLAGLPANASLAVGTQVLPAVGISLLAALGISLLAFYGSSLTRNTLQALGSGVLACIIATLLGVLASRAPALLEVPLWGPRLLALILVPLMAVVIFALAAGNYYRRRPGPSAWWRNILFLVCSVVSGTLVTTAVYHRFWEAWLPLEPPHSYRAFSFHGRNEAAIAKPKVQAAYSRIAALLSDGRLWVRQRPLKPVKFVRRGVTYVVPQVKGRLGAGFMAGSNWRDVAVSELGCFAIQSDGSLWDLSGVQPGTRSARSEAKCVGSDRDWSKISGAWDHFSALKSDGSLWEWGRWQGRYLEWATPQRLGSDTDWVALADSFQSSVAFKADGSVWRWGQVQQMPTGGPSAKRLASPQKWLVLPGLRRPVSIGFDGSAVAAVCGDGTLWVGGNLLYRLLGAEAAQEASTQMVQLGTDSDWQAVELRGTPVVAVKRDGTLWKWDWGEVVMWLRGRWIAPPLVPLSHYPVWLSACQWDNGFLTLGTDGTLCLWEEPFHYPNGNRPDLSRLLAPTRIHAREIAALGQGLE